MPYGRAITICEDISNEKYSDSERLQAVEKILQMSTINAVKKRTLYNVIKWLYDTFEFESST